MLLATALAIATCTVQDLSLADAQKLALAAAPEITVEGQARGSRAIIGWLEKTTKGWAFKIAATHPCAPGLRVCSSLLGHYSVDARTHQVVDDDTNNAVSNERISRLTRSIKRRSC